MKNGQARSVKVNPCGRSTFCSYTGSYASTIVAPGCDTVECTGKVVCRVCVPQGRIKMKKNKSNQNWNILWKNLLQITILLAKLVQVDGAPNARLLPAYHNDGGRIDGYVDGRARSTTVGMLQTETVENFK